MKIFIRWLKWITHFFVWIWQLAKFFTPWLEWVAMVAAVLVTLVAANEMFLANSQETGQAKYDILSYSEFQQRATVLGNESDPIKRDAMCIGLSALGRSLDAQLPTNSRVFLAGMLGETNAGNLGYYYFLSDYLFPREVAISVGAPPKFTFNGFTGQDPTNLDELKDAGYDLVLGVASNGQLESKMLNPFTPRQEEPPPIPGGDPIVAFLLPLAVALAGTRMVRWLFRDLENVLSFGELLACGLALGAFFFTQAILGLRMAGARLEQFLGIAAAIWAVVEIILLLRRFRAHPPQINVRLFWWLLLIPAALMSWCLFRLAGTEGLLEFDAIAFWAFKAKILFYCAGPQIWIWFKDPALAYAHLDYPLLATLLHTFTYGVLGHVDEFVTKFWNVWMVVLLAAAVLGAGKFPNKRPWLIASVASAIVLLPLSVEFILAEGGTIPLFFFIVTASLQLALGMAEKQISRVRLGLLILMGAAMVKFEGMVLLAFWGLLLTLDKDCRPAFWPPKRIGWAGLVGFAGWIPYIIFRLHHPYPHPESAWLGVLIKNIGTVLSIAPVVCLAFVSRRFLNNDFASWTSPDNQHVIWSGHWTGWTSLFDQATLGLGWACLLVLAVACLRGGNFRWTVLRLALMFFVFTTFIGVVWSATHSQPLDYNGAISGSERIGGGRYCYQTLMAWFAAGFILLVRALPDQPSPTTTQKEKSPVPKPKNSPR